MIPVLFRLIEITGTGDESPKADLIVEIEN